MSLSPICCACQRFYRQKKTGYFFVEAMPRTNGVRPGKIDAELWQPYRVWAGDLWECQGCGHQLVAGVASRPVSERYHHDFFDAIEKTNARQLIVNDC